MPKCIAESEAIRRLQKYNLILVSKYTCGTDIHLLRCGFCGNQFSKKLSYVYAGKIFSCGCQRGLKRRRGSANIPGEYFSKIKRCSLHKGMEFSVTLEYLEQLLIKQNFKCKLSGLPIKLNHSTGIRNGTNTASLDRIDSSLGYVEGNVQWVHKDVNWMKQDFDQEYFLSLCRRIASNEH